jgi:hypothetical protein
MYYLYNLRYNQYSNGAFSQKIIIFDTFCGLCNQFYDIQKGINFCLKNNIKFTFRYASFRNDDLVSWYNVDFDRLFNISFLKQFDLYVDIHTLDLNCNNTFNYDSKLHSPEMLDSKQDILTQIYNINKKYIVLRGIFSLLDDIPIVKNIYPEIVPSLEIMRIYMKIRDELSLTNKKYNFIHYRYEHDYINYHKITDLPSLEYIINNIKFKNSNDYIYIASTNIPMLLKNVNVNKFILYKDENNEDINQLNFEQRGFIDFMFGKNSDELYGHIKSSFSLILNELKNTNNYY